MLQFFRNRRRKKIISQPTPKNWIDILAKNFPMYALLSSDDKNELQNHMKVFLSEKRFEGCGGLEITEEIKVTIAAQACLLLLHRKTNYYARVYSILVYPKAYTAPTKEYTSFGAVTEGHQVRAGEAWKDGTVVLSWKDVRFGASDINDGFNVVLHEFAHQLDMKNNVADGSPVLPRRSMYIAWARVLSKEYRKLQKGVKNDQKTVMDKYGATNPAEFFAVATESFFEKPKELKRTHPELYQQLEKFYHQDPVQFFEK